jgi:hypothetical protein
MFNVFLAVVLFATSTSGVTSPLTTETSLESAASQASKCGLGPVTFQFNDEMDEDGLSLGRVTAATDAQLSCVERAAGPYFIDVGPELQERFFRMQIAHQEAFMQDQSRKWLADRGLLGRVPRYVAGTTDDAAFTAEVENLCGPHARGAFKSRFGPHAISPDWLSSSQPSAEESEAFDCIMKVTLVAGYKMGFIGNEAIIEPAR